MTLAIAICAASLLCVGVCAGAHDNTVPLIACNLKAIKAAERPHYNNLMKKLRAAVRERNSRNDGYAYTLDSNGISLPEVAEWMSMERLCCPFLDLQLSAAGNQESWVLALTGPEGVKTLLEAEFPVR
jgi:hypothetical protein